jgi:hypothetical protein
MKTAALRDTISHDDGTVFCKFDVTDDAGNVGRHILTISRDDDCAARVEQFKAQLAAKDEPVSEIAKPMRLMSVDTRLADIRAALKEFPVVEPVKAAEAEAAQS